MTASSSASSEIAVVGGGDSAVEEATFLTRFAQEGHPGAPPRRAARLEDHGRPRVRERQDRVRLELRGRRDPRRGQADRRHPAGHRHRRDPRAAGHRPVHRDRPRPALGAGQGPGATWTTRATSWSRRAAPRPTCPASSPPATWWTTPTGRPSPRPAPAVRPPWTPSASWPTLEDAGERRGRRGHRACLRLNLTHNH